MQEARATGTGKRLAWPLRPIANDDQGELSREGDTSTGVLDMEKAEKEEKESTVTQGIDEKKREIRSPENEEQL